MKVGKVTTFVPVITAHPESWYLTVNNCTNDKCANVDWPVARPIYEKYSVGDTFNSEKP